MEGRSTTSSGGGGPAAYETSKAVDEYLMFHFAGAEELIPYSVGPKDAVGFTAQCALLCERHCAALQDFTGERGEPATALDVGCAVGGAVFELARSFPHVMGIDYSHKFIDAALEMKARGQMQYTAVEEADITTTRLARVDDSIDRNRARFMQGDACKLPASLLPVDAVLAANLLCRLPDPTRFLASLPRLVKPQGVVVLVSPYSWLHSWTPKAKWLGGFYAQDGTAVRTAQGLRSVMEGLGFELVEQSDMPFVIREHARKFQWGVSHATVWRKAAA